MIRLIDITPPVTAASPVFPGDERCSVRLVESVSAGAASNVSVVTTSVHNGAHVDAPLHLYADAEDIAALPLERFVGPCFVVDLSSGAGVRNAVRFAELPKSFFRSDGRARCERLLVKTQRRKPSAWTNDFRALSPEFVEGAAAAGVRLIGVDVPSVDPAESVELPAHRAALSKSMPLMENLYLCDVEAGFYELIALPMNWPGAEASPVRAVLRPLSDGAAAGSLFYSE